MLQLHVWRLSLSPPVSRPGPAWRDTTTSAAAVAAFIMYFRLKRRAEPVVVAPFHF